MLNYLEKVDKIAQLDICGMCKEEDDGDTIHVVGKTSGKNSEYYHRIFDGTWSAWEKINLDIEEGPLIPVYWKNRLFLFWTTVLQKGQDKGQVYKSVVDDISRLNGPISYTYEINICWSEYYNGKWQIKRTSDFNNPVVVQKRTEKDFITRLGLLYNINKKKQLDMYVELNASLPKSPESRYTGETVPTTIKASNLRGIPLSNSDNLMANDLGPSAYRVHKILGLFRLYNKHSEPETIVEAVKTYDDFSVLDDNRRSISKDSLELNYLSKKSNSDFKYDLKVEIQHQILKNKFYKSTDFSHLPISEFTDPRFVRDYQHLFFLETTRNERFIRDWDYYGLEPLKQRSSFQGFN